MLDDCIPRFFLAGLLCTIVGFHSDQGLGQTHTDGESRKLKTITPTNIYRCLPDDVETWMYSPVPDKDASSFEIQEFDSNTALLRSAYPDGTDLSSVQQEIVFAVTVARNFKLPQTIPGRSTFEGCQIYFFAKPSADKIKPQMRTNKQSLVKNNVKIYAVELDTTSEQKDFYYLAFPQPNVAIVATKENFLVQVLERWAVGEDNDNANTGGLHTYQGKTWMASRVIRRGKSLDDTTSVEMSYNRESSVIAFAFQGNNNDIDQWRESINRNFTFLKLPEIIDRDDVRRIELAISQDLNNSMDKKLYSPTEAAALVMASLGFLFAL
jgi:hypothetical protein